MAKKYYVVKIMNNGKYYKKYKCIDGWSKNPEDCWQFTKSGALQIANRLNQTVKSVFSPFYDIEEVNA